MIGTSKALALAASVVATALVSAGMNMGGIGLDAPDADLPSANVGAQPSLPPSTPNVSPDVLATVDVTVPLDVGTDLTPLDAETLDDLVEDLEARLTYDGGNKWTLIAVEAQAKALLKIVDHLEATGTLDASAAADLEARLTAALKLCLSLKAKLGEGSCTSDCGASPCTGSCNTCASSTCSTTSSPPPPAPACSTSCSGTGGTPPPSPSCASCSASPPCGSCSSAPATPPPCSTCDPDPCGCDDDGIWVSVDVEAAVTAVANTTTCGCSGELAAFLAASVKVEADA